MSEPESASRDEPLATSAVAVADAGDEPESHPGHEADDSFQGRRPWWRALWVIRLAWLAA